MTHRLMVVCLGGLAGAGALVCCDLDEGAEALDAQAQEEPAEPDVQGGEPAEAEPALVH